ncbi:MAG TPA: transposase [Terriglobia bacterium]|nr:transposase [Terriglobia bacterium]
MGGFHSQSGHGGFSVSPGEVDGVVRYIEQKEAHRRATSFEEEYRPFLKAYEVEYDERYLWD